MFKKSKVRAILERLGKNQSTGLISKTLQVSRSTVTEIQALFENSGKTWDDISCLDDEMLYTLFYPEKFKHSRRYAPVDYKYVHGELMKTGVTEKSLWEVYCSKCSEKGEKACSYLTFTRNYQKYTVKKSYTSRVPHKPGVTLEVDWSGPTMSYIDSDTGKTMTAYLFVATMPYSQKSYVEAAPDMKEKSWLSCHVHMFEFFGGTPLRIVCDNLKAGVVSHPVKNDIILNEHYLALAEYYSVAIMPAGVRKPKHKASVEGTVGLIASAIIARLRNKIFASIDVMNEAIRNALDDFNNRPFQKREGNRSTIFELEEKHCLKPLPLVPYEVCEWSYEHKVYPNSHIWWNNGQYSVPCKYIGEKVNVKFNDHMVFIYHDREVIASHQILPRHLKYGMRTDESHLPMRLKQEMTPEMMRNKAREIGPQTFEVIRRMFAEAKVEEQPLQTTISIVALGTTFSPEILEKACELSLKEYHMPFYGTILRHAQQLNQNKDDEDYREEGRKTGIVRGAEYYK